MTDLSEHAEAANRITADGKKWDAMTAAELSTLIHGAMASSLATGSLLVRLCGDDYAAACLEIRRARELPPRVLMRRYREAERLIEDDELPSVQQVAALCAVIMSNIERMRIYFDRARAGPLN